MNRTIIGIFLALLWFSACDSKRVFEEKKDFKKGYWVFSDAAIFDFNIKDPSLKYKMLFNIRVNNKYAYQNLYLQYYLEDSIGQVLKKDLINLQLFNPVTGVPLGDGLGDIYDLQRSFIPEYQFDKAGKYKMRIDHFMRKDTLPDILAVGFRLEKVEEDQ